MGEFLIQVDISGHPPIKTSSHTYVILAISIFILEIFSRFSSPKLPGLFQGPKKYFLGALQ